MDGIRKIASFRNLRKLTLKYEAIDARDIYDDGFDLKIVDHLQNRKEGVPLEILSISLVGGWNDDFEYSADYEWAMDGRLVEFDNFVSDENEYPF